MSSPPLNWGIAISRAKTSSAGTTRGIWSSKNEKVIPSSFGLRSDRYTILNRVDVALYMAAVAAVIPDYDRRVG